MFPSMRREPTQMRCPKRDYSGIVPHTVSMRFFWNNKRIVALAFALVVAVLAGVVYWRAAGALRRSAESLNAEHDLKFTVHAFVPPIDSGFEWVSAPAIFTQGPG